MLATDLGEIIARLDAGDRKAFEHCILDAVEIGDLETLQQKIKQFEGKPDFDDLIVYVSQLCETMDLEQLEYLVRKLGKTV